MLTEPHTAVSKVVVKDAYGTVTATNNTTFCCLIQRRSVYKYIGSQKVEVGKGMIYTTSSLTFTPGTKVIVDAVEFDLKDVRKCEGLDGAFTHWQLTYG